MANFYRLHRSRDGSPVDLNIDFAIKIDSDPYGTHLTMMPHGETVIVREKYKYSSGTLFFPPGQDPDQGL